VSKGLYVVCWFTVGMAAYEQSALWEEGHSHWAAGKPQFL
jgi:hypothetical protein